MSVLAEVAAPGQVIPASQFRLVAVLGQPQLSGPDGYAGRVASASVNDAGEVVFVADTAGPASASALVHIAAQGHTTVLVRAGETAPGGGRYASFGEVDLGEDGRLLFQARLAGSEAVEGVFLRTGSGVRPVARAGGPAPGGGHYAGFRQLSLGPDARLAYAARTTDGRTSLVIRPSHRGSCRVLATGTRVAGGVVEDFTVSRLGLAVCVVARIRYGVSKRRVALVADEDRLSPEPWLRDGGRLPGTGVVRRLVGPPAICFDRGYVGLALDPPASVPGGGHALAARPAGGPARVLVCSGDPAPGLPGRRITGIGPPIANTGVPGGERGIAAAVQLGRGQHALWLQVAGRPRRVAVPLLAGGRTRGEPAVRVGACTPVKLTNTGILLVRSTVDIDGRRAEGLLLLGHLFD
jgi:hypothetical protein